MTKFRGHTLALIPARGGSKGVPRKNVRPFQGKPLIHWTIAAAAASGVADCVMVSTDDDEIMQASLDASAEVPFLRPRELAEDATPMMDVVLATLEVLDREHEWRPEFLLLLQPTSPLRTAEDIRSAAALLRSAGADAVVSVTPTKQHPFWLQRLNPEGYLQPYDETPAPTRRQDLPEIFALNGAIYLTKVETLRNERTFRPRKTVPYVMPGERSVDIDTEWDWKVAELFAANL